MIPQREVQYEGRGRPRLAQYAKRSLHAAGTAAFKQLDFSNETTWRQVRGILLTYRSACCKQSGKACHCWTGQG